MKRIVAILALAMTGAAMQAAAAQGMKDMKDMPMSGSAATATHKATGTVKKADASRGTVTFDHEPVASMKWPAMTMEFEVSDKKMLDRLKPGAKVQFEFREKSKGKYVVTDVRP
jgi:Cu(I)/Ag(I) efflux system periplasmic protein CusF